MSSFESRKLAALAARLRASGQAGKRNDPIVGVIWVTLAMATFAGLGTFGKYCIQAGLDPLQVIFFRNFFCLFLMLPLLHWRGPSLAVTTQVKLYGVRVGLAFVSMMTWFTALSLIPFAELTAMGFLAFMLTIPLFLAAAGALVGFMGEHRRRSDPIVLAVCALALPSLHVIAAGMFLLFVGAMLVRRRPDWKKGAFAALLTLGAVFVWGRLGGVGVGHANALDVKDAFSRGQGFDSLTILFRFSWSDPPTLLNYGMWSVFGPYRFDAIALMIVALAIAIFVAQRPWKTTAAPSACKRAAILFAIVSAVVPWGMYAPSEATFINLRMMTLAVGLLVTLLPPAWFEARRPRLALVGLSMFMTLSFAHHAIGFSRESRSATALIERVPDNAVLMSLPYHDKTEHFGRLFRLTHFLPMYYTVRSGGINTQFWANYTEHLPVGYRRGKRPHHTPDWQPDKFEPSHLVASDYLLVQSPTASDPDATRKAHASAKQTIERQAETVACDGLWCLYRLQHDTSAQR